MKLFSTKLDFILLSIFQSDILSLSITIPYTEWFIYTSVHNGSVQKIKAKLVLVFAEHSPKGVRKKHFITTWKTIQCITDGYQFRMPMAHKTTSRNIFIAKFPQTEKNTTCWCYAILVCWWTLLACPCICTWIQILVALKAQILWRAEKHKNPLIILLCKSNRVDVDIIKGMRKMNNCTNNCPWYWWDLLYNMFQVFLLLKRCINHTLNITEMWKLFFTKLPERRQNTNKRSIVNLNKIVLIQKGTAHSCCVAMIYISHA